VKSLVIFLNELSFNPGNVMLPEEMLPHVLSTLAALRATRRIRSDLTVVGHVSLSNVLLGGGTHSLAAVLRGDTHKEEWRLLQSLDQVSPWNAYSDSIMPGDFQEVRFNGISATGMLWAKQNESTIVSFAFPPNWDSSFVDVQFHEMNETCNIVATNVQIPNLSKLEHVTAHRTLINDYGRTVSPSSLVYQGDGFVIRMYFNDHNPPHFHVMIRRDTSEAVARYDIRTLDRLSGNLPPALRKRVEEWAAARRADLMRNWIRCRARQHPISLQD
jgi:hypothetical protein